MELLVKAPPCRCPVGEQRRPGLHPDTVRMKWSKEVSKVVMECYLKS